jgi:hypothetical protein
MMKSTNRDIGRIMGLFAPRPDRPPDIEGEDFDTRRRRLRQEDRARFFDDLSAGIGGVRDWMKQIPGSDDWLGRVSSPAPLGNTRWSHLLPEPIMPPGSLAVPPRPQAPATPVADGSLFDQDAWQKFGTTTETAQQKLDGLSATTIAPQLDASAIDTAISKIDTLLRKIGLVGSAAAALPTMVDTFTARVTAGGSAGRTLRAGQNDYLHDNPD